MKTEYEMMIVLDAGEALEPIKQLRDEVNAHLSSMGVDEQMQVQSRMSFGILTTEREMTEQEIKQMRSIIHAELLTSGLSIRKSILDVELIRRKPGNVLQSAS